MRLKTAEGILDIPNRTGKNHVMRRCDICPFIAYGSTQFTNHLIKCHSLPLKVENKRMKERAVVKFGPLSESLPRFSARIADTRKLKGKETEEPSALYVMSDHDPRKSFQEFMNNCLYLGIYELKGKEKRFKSHENEFEVTH